MLTIGVPPLERVPEISSPSHSLERNNNARGFAAQAKPSNAEYLTLNVNAQPEVSVSAATAATGAAAAGAPASRKLSVAAASAGAERTKKLKTLNTASGGKSVHAKSPSSSSRDSLAVLRTALASTALLLAAVIVLIVRAAQGDLVNARFHIWTWFAIREFSLVSLLNLN